MIIVEHNATNNQISEIELTDEQIEQINEDRARVAQVEAARDNKKNALLEKLGITEEEAKLLLS